MAKLWAGRQSGETNKAADDFNQSLSFDYRLYKEDITGSIAHSKMLAKCEIISYDDQEKIEEGLLSILKDIEEGNLTFDNDSEDIHMFIEEELTKRIGDAGKRLHTARSRNDQVALDTRLYVSKETKVVMEKILRLIDAIITVSKDNKDSIMPGYTHLQRAQPVSFAHYLLSYASMLLRDYDRFKDSIKRCEVSPIGACALAGTTYETDRFYEANLLGLDSVSINSIDSVSDRDFALEFMSHASLLMMHLSRMAEEMILFSSWEFKFIEFSDDFTTGSSIMPQKKNSDMAELVRGKTGRVYGDLISLLVTLKGLPLAYNKDMQEDKERLFDTIDTIKACLDIMAPMIETMKVFKENMLNAAKKGFINATDLADYLTKKGMEFRNAYKISGTIVQNAIKEHFILEEISLEEYKKYSDLFEEDIYDAIDLKNCANRRNSYGGTSIESVENQINIIEGIIKNEKDIH